MPNEGLVESLRSRLPDEACVQEFDDALAALAGDNRRRAQHFAVTLRELFGHVLSSRASNEAVEKCSWYAVEQGARGPTRRQRAMYLSRGGLSDAFIRETLKLDPDEFHADIRKAFDELNENTHIRPGAPPLTGDALDEFADRAIASFAEVFDVIDEVRASIKQAIEPNLQNEAASVFIAQTIDDLDILAGRYTTEGVMFDDASVVEIGAEYIHYRITGTVDVELHYGGKSDPAQINENFPFTCTIVARVDEPFNFIEEMTVMQVDTSSWFGDNDEAAQAAAK